MIKLVLSIFLAVSLLAAVFGVTRAQAAEQYAFIATWGKYGVTNGNFNSPQGIAVDPSSGDVYVIDTMNNRVQKFSGNGTFIAKWGSFFDESVGKFNSPQGIAVDSEGNVYVADTMNNKIQKFNANGALISTFGSYGTINGKFKYPEAVAVDSEGNVYVVDTGNNRVQKFSGNGTFIAKWGILGVANGNFNSPQGIALDSHGNVYVADTMNNRVQKFSSDGTFISKWGAHGGADVKFNLPESIAVDPKGNVHVVDTGNSRMQKFSGNGTFLTKWGSQGNANGLFNMPQGIAIDSSGNVYVADTLNNRVQKFNTNLIESSQTVMISGIQYDVGVFGSSNTRDFTFDQDRKQISIIVENSEEGGSIAIEVGKVLVGPYTITVDGQSSNETVTIPEDENLIHIEYPPNTEEIIVTGANVVPEFSASIGVIIVGIIGLVVVATRIRSSISKL